VFTFAGTGDEVMLMPTWTAGVTNTLVDAELDCPATSVTVAVTVKLPSFS